MAKVKLLDLDGVVIKGRHKYFSEKFSEEHNVPIGDILPFFKGEYKKAAIDEIDIKEVLPSYLEKWGWQCSSEEFLQYWFEGEREVDQKVLEQVRQWRKRGIQCYLASDNEKNRADYLMQEVGLEKEFDGAFFSYQSGNTKSDEAFFENVATSLHVNPEEIEYWDDDPENVEVANNVGLRGRVYSSPEDLKS